MQNVPGWLRLASVGFVGLGFLFIFSSSRLSVGFGWRPVFYGGWLRLASVGFRLASVVQFFLAVGFGWLSVGSKSMQP